MPAPPHRRLTERSASLRQPRPSLPIAFQLSSVPEVVSASSIEKAAAASSRWRGEGSGRLTGGVEGTLLPPTDLAASSGVHQSPSLPSFSRHYTAKFLTYLRFQQHHRYGWHCCNTAHSLRPPTLRLSSLHVIHPFINGPSSPVIVYPATSRPITSAP